MKLIKLKILLVNIFNKQKHNIFLFNITQIYFINYDIYYSYIQITKQITTKKNYRQRL